MRRYGRNAGSLSGVDSAGCSARRSWRDSDRILEVSGESEVDPESEAVGRLLADARSKCAAKLREDERQHEILQAERESLEATGLASIDADVRVVAGRSASGRWIA